MFHLNFPRPANKVVLLTCLLAVTAFLAGALQARAQAPAHRNNETILNPVLSGRLNDHTAPQILEGTAIRTDHYDSDKMMRLVLSIRPPHMVEEEQFLRELTDKKSPNFHKFLTQEEWNARFAPSVEDEQKVVDWAQSAGLTVTKRYGHRLIVDVEGKAGVIEKAFGVTINTYKVGEEVDFGNDRDPVLPNQLSGILYNVQGLNNIQRDRSAHPSDAELHAPDYVPGPVVANGGEGHADGDPVKAKAMLEKLHAVQSKTQQDDFANGPVANLTDGVIDPYNVYSSQMYDYGALQALGHCCNPGNLSGGTPNVSNIAIAGFGQFLESDLNTFAGDFGLAYDNNYYFIDGTPFCNSDGSCDTGETTEDVEYSIAMSNSFGSYLDTSHNYAYLGGNGNNSTFTDIYSDMLSDNTARVMTTSWSCTEVYGCSTSTMDSRHSIFANMVGMGWTLIAASGDRGATDDCAHTSVAFPASDYLVVAAGGTQLDLYTDGTWYYENGWQGGFSPYVSSTNTGSCAHNDGGSGGGISTYYAKQSWQDTFGGSYRLTPDISLNALGLAQIEVEGGSLCCSANGTSVVAPELAGFFAQENAYLNYMGNKCSGSGTTACAPIGNPLPFVYEEGNSNNAAHNPFYDMTTGCNSNNITSAGDLTYYCAHSGYDLVTGWGSANMLQLAWALNWEVTGADGGPSVSFSGPATNTWYNTNQQVSWTIIDNPGAGFTSANAVGIAGEATGWDSIASDSYTEPHGGSGDFFWDGPQYINDATGCIALVAGACVGGVTQGCHTAHVRGWNNQGEGTGDQTYGPICYDTVAPTITISTNPTTSGSIWVDKSVTVTLTASDPGGSGASGIKATYYAIDTGNCVPGGLGACTVYTGPFVQAQTGQHYIYYFTEDNAGNFSTETYLFTSIDEIAPTTTVSPSGDLQGSTYYSKVSITLNASDTGGSGVANTYYTVDGGAQTTYTGSAFTVASIATHTVKYWSVDVAGNVESQHTLTFTIAPDTASTLTAPTTSTFLGPSVTFSWGAEAGANGYFVHIGNTGAGSENLLNSSEYSAGTTSVTVNSLPTTGGTIYVRLFTDYGGVHVFNDYSFTAAKEATITAPTPTTTLLGPDVTFTWAAATGSINGYFLHVGTTGAGSDNLLNSAEYSTGTTSVTVKNVPTSGGSIFVRLFTDYNGTHVYQDYAYYAPAEATLSSPTPISTFAGPSVKFTWAEATGSVSGYFLHIGSTGVGSDNILNSAEYSTSTDSVTVSDLPLAGGTIYVRLFTDYNGTHVYQDYTYMAASQATLISPANGSTLTGSSATFEWSAATGSFNGYFLHIGTTGVGSENVLNSTEYSTTTTSATVTGLPTTGGTLYVRVFTDYNGVHVYKDYTINAE